MDPTTREVLRTARRLIKDGDKDAARRLVKPVLAEDGDNIDAWWLAAYAASNPHDMRLALAQVLRLNPDHRPARQLLARLNDEHPLDASLTREVLLPLPGRKRKRRPDQPRLSNRWVWNVVLVLGVLALVFGNMALISQFVQIDWLDDTVATVGDTLGLGGDEQSGRLGQVKGGDPAQPYDIPITQNKGASLGGVVEGALEEDEAHLWAVFAARGQEIMAMLQFTTEGDTRYVMELHDAGGTKLAEGVGTQNSATVTLIYLVQETGSYTLVLIGRPDGPEGFYVLGVDVLD